MHPIRYARKKLVLDQEQLGKLIGVSKMLVSNWERGMYGKHGIKRKHIEKMQQLFHIEDLNRDMAIFHINEGK